MNEVVNLNGSWMLRTASTVSPSGSNTQVQFNDSIPTGTSLLTCASSTFKDFSTNNFTVTPVGNATTSSNAPFYSNWSNAFDGSGDYLTVANNVAFNFGSGDFTIELWMYQTFKPSAAPSYILNYGHPTVNGPFLIYWDQVLQKITFYSSSTGTSWDIANQVPIINSVSLNTWYHIAITRSGNTFRTFLNGSVVSTFTSSATLYIPASAPLRIGADNTGANGFYGNISNLRLVKGNALYTGSFTPPTSAFSTTVLPSGTSLLTCNSNAFKDFSSNNFSITPTGNTAVNTLSPFSTSSISYWSNYFDGNGDYLSTPASSAYDFGTGDFTVEAWVYLAGNSATDSGGYRHAAIISTHSGNGSGAANQGWEIMIGGSATTTGELGLYIENFSAGAYSSTSAIFSISQQAWHHIAITRQSGTVRFFFNGTQQDVNKSFTSNMTSGGACWIGAFSLPGYVRYINGYISNLRVVKGTALYTRNFTTRSIPFSTTSGVFGATSGLTYNKSSGLLTTTVVSSSALTGSLTKLTDGTDYLRAGSNVSLTTGSNGAVTINSSALPGSLVGYSSGSRVVTTETTTSTSYTDLATVGPTVTMTTGTSVVCHIFAATLSSSTTGNSYISVDVSGASTVAAGDSAGVNGGGSGLVTITTATWGFSIATAVIFTGLTPGTNTFTMKYRSQSGIRSFLRRSMIVQRLD